MFGICEKQLVCHSCRVNFISKFDSLPEIQEEEEDVLVDLGRLRREDSTRMACQIKLSTEMNGCLIEIPRNAFAFFEKFKDDDY